MTKEQDKAIERCNKLIETEYSNWIGITNQKAIETVLNMLKEKEAEIEKKDKMIDLMAEFIEKVTVDLKVAFGENMLWNQNEIKQYFERKAEQSSSINKTQEKN